MLGCGNTSNKSNIMIEYIEKYDLFGWRLQTGIRFISHVLTYVA